MQPDPGITVNCCGDAAIHARRAEEAKAQRRALPANKRTAESWQRKQFDNEPLVRVVLRGGIHAGAGHAVAATAPARSTVVRRHLRAPRCA